MYNIYIYICIYIYIYMYLYLYVLIDLRANKYYVFGKFSVLRKKATCTESVFANTRRHVSFPTSEISTGVITVR